MNQSFWIGLLSGMLGTVSMFMPMNASAQTEQQIRLAFRNIRSDDIPNNGTAATEWLYAHRNQIKDAMLDELYRTDRQGRDALFNALLAAKDFKPDARFCRLLVGRLNEEDTYVSNSSLGLKEQWGIWPFIDKHYDQFKALLLENLQTTDDMWCAWATVYFLHKKDDLKSELPNFSPHVWALAAKSLTADEIRYNASQAVRFYLIVGPPALPHLQEAKKSPDQQARDYATATIDAMGGSKRAYGYLASETNLISDLFSGSKGQPAWLEEEINKWNAQGEHQKYH